MNIEQIALLLNRDRMIISRHINNLFNVDELIEKQVCAKNARTGPDGKNNLFFRRVAINCSINYKDLFAFYNEL